MSKKTKEVRDTSADLFDVLEKAQEQYQQYIEVSEIYKLPLGKQENNPPPVQSLPLTTGGIF